MREINPEKIKKAEIVVGIPSFNEAENISFVTKQVDRGLQKYFSQKSAVIINCDNNSGDNTAGVFLRTKTRTPKIYISTPVGVRGKGNNLRNLFLKIKDLKAGSAVTIDADLKSITPEWIKCFLEPVIAKRYDFVTPIYHRHKYDGQITNHFCHPLLYGLLGYNIRQPIAGDMAFSKKLVDYCLKQKWSPVVKNYGIDIFMTLNVIKAGLKLCQISLGSKVHSPSSPKLDNMFVQVADTFFDFLSKNEKLWKRKIRLKTPPVVCRARARSVLRKPRVLKVDFGEKFPKINSALWSKMVYQLLHAYQTKSNKKSIIKLLKILFFGRMTTFIKETSKKNQAESEKIIQNQARHFFRTRDSFLPPLASLVFGGRP